MSRLEEDVKYKNGIQEQTEEPTFEEILMNKSIERLKPGQSSSTRIKTYTFKKGDKSLWRIYTYKIKHSGSVDDLEKLNKKIYRRQGKVFDKGNLREGSIIYYRTKSHSEKKKSAKTKRSNLVGKIFSVKGSSDGWLEVLLQGNDGNKKRKEIINRRVYTGWILPDYLKISVLAEFGDYYICKPIEGKYKGRTIAIRKNLTNSLIQNRNYSPAANVYFRYSKQTNRGTVWIQGIEEKVPAIISVLPFKESGKYKIEIPDGKHNGGRSYLSSSVYSETWFRINDPYYPNKDRYLHIGSGSLGCVTITQKTVWNKFYKKLINSRLDNKHIGYLHVEITD